MKLFLMALCLLPMSATALAQTATVAPQTREIVSCKNGTGPMIAGFKIISDAAKKRTVQFTLHDGSSGSKNLVDSTSAWTSTIEGSLYNEGDRAVIAVNARIGKPVTATIVTLGKDASEAYAEHFDCELGK